MKFYEIVDQVTALLRSRGRLSYRALTVEFALDDDSLAALKEELIEAQEVAVDKDGKILVWVGAAVKQESGNRGIGTKTNNSQCRLSD